MTARGLAGLVSVLVGLPVAALAQVPPLAMFADGFPAGLYAIGSSPSTTVRDQQCLTSPAPILFGRNVPLPGCRVTVIADRADHAILSWSCPNGNSGRSEVRRDYPGQYVTQIQGVQARLPYAARPWYQRIGACPSGDQSKSRSPQGGAAR